MPKVGPHENEFRATGRRKKDCRFMIDCVFIFEELNKNVSY